jgi:hypothetical protein
MPKAMWKNKWEKEIKQYTKYIGEDRDYLVASDFQYDVYLEFEDGSKVSFKYALSYSVGHEYIVSEHCGYHRFPFKSIKHCEVK